MPGETHPIIYANGASQKRISLPFLLARRVGPPHVHVEKGGNEAKFWLRPIQLVHNEGFSTSELRKIIDILEEDWIYLEKCYKEFHGIRTRHRR